MKEQSELKNPCDDGCVGCLKGYCKSTDYYQKARIKELEEQVKHYAELGVAEHHMAAQASSWLERSNVRIADLTDEISKLEELLLTKEEAEYFFNECYREYVELDDGCNCELCQKDRKTIAKLQKIAGMK